MTGTNKPTCAMCGRPYGQRRTHDEWFKWKHDKPRPVYRGNEFVVKEAVWREGAAAATTVDDFGAKRTDHGGFMHGVDYDFSESVAYRRLWDGESYWTPYEPFCTLRCAFDYARRAYRSIHK